MTGRPPEPGWVASDRAHVWHPYTQMLTAPAPIPIERAEGVYLHTADGRRILDGISSWWVNIHGHSHPRLNQALRRQVESLAQVIFAGFAHEAAGELAARLVGRAPAGLTRVFFSDDGSTAVEAAIKMAYQFWRNRGEPGRTLFVALENGYHGDTVGAMSASGIATFRSPFERLLFEVRSAHAHDRDGRPFGPVRSGCRGECGQSLEEILARESDRIAAVIIEPMLQGAGGMIIWPPEFLRLARELTTAAGVLLIADEVLTGFGRTGKTFACEHGPITPDLMCLSKALTGGYLPLGATLATESVYAAFLHEDRSRAFFHGHSFTGNALSCAVALESLAVFEEEGCLERIARLERLFTDRLEQLARLPIVENPRVLGGVAAFEVVPRSGGGYLDAIGPTLAAEFLARDILLRPLGNTVYVMPPYVIDDGQAHHVFDVIEAVVGKPRG